MSTVHSPIVIAAYLERFDNIVTRAKAELHFTIAKVAKASITQKSQGNLEAELVIEMPASSDYMVYHITNQVIQEIVTDLHVWIDINKKDITYSRQVDNGVETIIISFTK